MKKGRRGITPIYKVFLVIVAFALVFSVVWTSEAGLRNHLLLPTDLLLPGEMVDSGPKFQGTALDKNTKKIDLQDPPNLERKVEYDPETRQYVITETIGGKFYKAPVYMSFEEYQRYEASKTKFDYWKQRSAESSLISPNGMIPKLYVNNQIFDRIFGGSKVDIRPQGTAELIFAGRFNRNENPILNERQRITRQFDFDQKIQLNVTGNIGDKLKTSVNYNTEATFDFENQMKLEYTGYEDEIIKKIELGNVSLPLNSSLISGSQSLFGIKTQLQFGRLTVTSVFSQQKSEKKQIKITNGAQKTEFKFLADNYEANKHFFLSHYFREQYDRSLAEPPIIKTNVLISRVEVWVTNRNRVGDEDTRDVLALIDMGENQRIYSNNPQLTTSQSPYPNSQPGTNAPASNNLLDIIPASSRNVGDNAIATYFGDKGGPDNYAKIRARKLSDREYTFHPQLGYISLNAALNADEVLAVAYRYTVDGVEYTVGEFSNERTETNPPTMLYTKLLKNVSLKTSLPIWDLMMKNIYSLNAFQINSDQFKLDVLYLDEKTANNINYLPVGPDNVKNIPLIRVLGLDKLDVKQTPTPDGVFDFVNNITINAANGRIIFTKVEPFGSYLYDLLSAEGDVTTANNIAFTELYDSTRFKAQQLPRKNKFTISGSFQSTSNSEFSLNAINIPPGSVVVKSGTQVLTEGVDYTVDYNVGRVKIVNAGILSSGSPITVDLESSTLFGIQSRTFIGNRFDYKVNDQLNLGGTFIRLSERPLTQKVNIGDEPIANNMYGFDVNYRTESRYLTTLVDRLPLIETKQPSSITVSAEYARLDPGHSRLLNTKNNKSGISYIDDFEGSRSSIDLKSANSWTLSSTPAMFPESRLFNDLSYGFNRARLSFYQIDNLFFSRTDNRTPQHLRNDRNQLSNHYLREVTENEVFPSKQIPTGQPNILSTLDLTYYPRERGPYNYTITGLNADGSLRNPQAAWAGIMRRLETNDFEALNVEFIEFWLLDPFIYKPGSGGGDLYFNLGSISEDVLKDGKESIENGLPADGNVERYDSTTWGRVGTLYPLSNAFGNTESARAFQDVGLDGLTTEQERSFFKSTYLDLLEAAYGTNSTAYLNAVSDPSADDFMYYRGSNLDNVQASILDRYKFYNGQEGNSPTEQQSIQRTGLSNAGGRIYPDSEDINNDQAQSDRDEYFQYRVRLSPGDLQNPDQNSFITDRVVAPVRLANGKVENVTWYQFRVPLSKFESRVGEIQDFRAIRFMRAFLTGFNDTVTLRFARLQLVRGEWRRIDPSVTPGEGTEAKSDAIFDLSTINIEENAKRSPIPYVLPPGIVQERNLQDVRGDTRVNEQSLLLNACNFKKDDQVMAYKITNMDFRSYKKVEMFIHAEGNTVQNNEMVAFVRFGIDYTDNYYEYEIPLTITPDGTQNPDLIWPSANKMSLPLGVLQVAKQLRNSSGIPVTTLFPYQDGKNRVWIKGNPDLGNVRSIVVGIRNRSGVPEDPKCIQVWFNELLLTEFDEQGGWAATGRLNAQLADFANVTLSGSRSTIGFGSIDKKVSERNRSDDRQYDVSSNIELGKFFPEKVGMRIPMFVSYSEAISTPQFAPNNPDILLDNVLDVLTKAQQDSIKRITEDYTRRKSISFTNVKKERVDSKKTPRLYDIENFSVTYSYNDQYRRNYTIEYDVVKTYRAALAYNFAVTPKEVRPFDKIVNNKNLKLIKDFNFNYLPSALDFRIDVNRMYAENKVRNINTNLLAIPATFNKDFRINRVYGFRYDLTKSLKVDYNATNMSIVDEPVGKIDTREEKDSILTNLRTLGRTTDFSQNTNINYAVPINKLPYMDFVQMNASYGARYDWRAASLATPKFANTISNSQSFQINPNFNMTQLYGKSKYLKALMTPQRNAAANRNNPLEKLKVNKTPEQERQDSIARAMNKNDLKKILARGLIMVRTINFSYRQTNGQLLPGYIPQTDLLGMDFGRNNAPGLGFVFGSQQDIRFKAAENGWITTYDSVSNRFARNNREEITGRINIEPMPDMRIDLNFQRSIGFSYQEFFRYDNNPSSPTFGKFRSFAETETGNFAMSIITIRSAFEKLDAKNPNPKSALFDEFMDNRFIISQRLAAEDGNFTQDTTGYFDGYGRYSQQVLIPAFIAAYTGRSVNRVTLNPFPKIPLPNWRVNYSGLIKIPIIAEYFTSFVLNHSYVSTYNVNSFNRPTTIAERYVATNNFVPKYEIQQITISETFAPLIGFDMVLKSKINVNLDYKQSRNLGLSFANTRLEQMNTQEYNIAIGYTTNNLKLPFSIGNGQKVLTNDLNVRMDFNIRVNRGVVHRMEPRVSETINGSRVISIKPSVEYILNQRFQVRVFYDRLVTDPFINTSFPTKITSFGFSLRINIGA